jgi:hypothetical protein
MVDTEIRLYVNSVKTLTGTIEVERLYVPRPRLPTTVKTEPVREHVLPDDQRKTVEMVERISRKYGLAVKVVDVAKENVLRRIMQKEMEKVKIFPTLIASSGERVEGNMTEQQIESFFLNVRRRGKQEVVG